MTPTLIGYFPKRIVRRGRAAAPGVLEMFPCAPPVEEICSVSDCIARAPENWREQGRHNGYDLYDSQELAWSVVPTGEQADFELFAYRLFPVLFLEGKQEPLEKRWDLAVEPMPRSFVRLGWDAVEGGNHQSFGCSPLSCNHQAGQVGIPVVNRFCLVCSKQHGFELARGFSISKPEPGPYCVVEVWRKREAVAARGRKGPQRF